MLVSMFHQCLVRCYVSWLYYHVSSIFICVLLHQSNICWDSHFRYLETLGDLIHYLQAEAWMSNSPFDQYAMARSHKGPLWLNVFEDMLGDMGPCRRLQGSCMISWMRWQRCWLDPRYQLMFSWCFHGKTHGKKTKGRFCSMIFHAQKLPWVCFHWSPRQSDRHIRGFRGDVPIGYWRHGPWLQPTTQPT